MTQADTISSADIQVEPSMEQPAGTLEASQAPTHQSKGKPKGKVKVLPKQRIVKVLSVGMEVTGKVKRISEFGAFVDIGVGRDGLLHISELSTSRVRKVSDVVSEGQEVTVWIKDLDRDKNRISLTMVPPGTKTIRDLEVGALVTGTVQRLTNYGAFIDIGLERDAMLHVKEMGDGFVAKPEDVVKVGDEIETRIIGVDKRRGRIDLSLKGLRPAVVEESPEPEIALEPVSFDDDEEDLPTMMELAFRQAFDGDMPPSSRSHRGSRRPKQGKRSRYAEQDEIISRTLRYRNERG